jgi:hypothetical protein
MRHSHADGATPEEIFAFAGAVLNKGAPLSRIANAGDNSLTYQSRRSVTRAELNFTKDDGRWQDRKWESVPAQLDSRARRVSAQIPEGARAWYINLYDDRGLVVSSEHSVPVSSAARE